MTATGQRISRAPDTVFFGRPADLALNRERTLVAVKNSHGLLIVDAVKLSILANLALPDPGREFARHLGGNGPAGIAWSADGSAIWEADAFNTLREAKRTADGSFSWARALTIDPAGTAAPIGIVVVDDRHAYLALSGDNSVACIDLIRLSVTCRVNAGVAPYGVVVADGKLFVTNWGGRRARASDATQPSDGTPTVVDRASGAAATGSVSVIDLRTMRAVREIPTGLHPSAVIAARNQRFVYVANAQSDSISEIDTSSLRVRRVFNLGTPNITLRSPEALSFSADGRELFAVESISNDLVEISLGSGRVLRRMQTQWYPSAAACCVNGKVIVAAMKGIGSDAISEHLPVIVGRHRPGGFNAYDYAGSIEAIDPQTAPEVFEGKKSDGSALRGLFNHVVYVIKENHTYDDIYGDLAAGDGDAKLCTFCPVTPNQHALAERFGIFDRFFVNGTVSADGHNWADSAIATDYVERSLSAFVRSYPSAGNDPLAYSTSGFIWNRMLQHGLTFRDYGEFIPDVVDFTPADATWSDFYHDELTHGHHASFRLHPAIKTLAANADYAYPSFSLRIPDLVRADAFIADLHRFERAGTFPNLALVALGNDHTAGDDAGYPTRRAFAADNDLALGRIVEAISHSRFWADTVIFVVEDDAQDGYDHVDGHRTAALVISPRNTRGGVYHEFYNQASVLRTIEDIFGLTPLTLFDRIAPPIVAPLLGAPDLTPYTAHPAVTSLDELNPGSADVSETIFKDREGDKR